MGLEYYRALGEDQINVFATKPKFSDTPLPFRGPPPTSSPAIDKTGQWVGRDDNGLKALFQIKDQRKYCPAYIP